MTMIDKRRVPRQATRLRPGKLLDGDGHFLADCAIVDRSVAGVRIRLFERDVLAGRDTESEIALFDESEALRWRARVAWAAGAQAGLAFADGPDRLEPAEAAKISGRYYALG